MESLKSLSFDSIINCLPSDLHEELRDRIDKKIHGKYKNVNVDYEIHDIGDSHRLYPDYDRESSYFLNEYYDEDYTLDNDVNPILFISMPKFMLKYLDETYYTNNTIPDLILRKCILKDGSFYKHEETDKIIDSLNKYDNILLENGSFVVMKRFDGDKYFRHFRKTIINSNHCACFSEYPIGEKHFTIEVDGIKKTVALYEYDGESG